MSQMIAIPDVACCLCFCVVWSLCVLFRYNTIVYATLMVCVSVSFGLSLS